MVADIGSKYMEHIQNVVKLYKDEVKGPREEPEMHYRGWELYLGPSKNIDAFQKEFLRQTAKETKMSEMTATTVLNFETAEGLKQFEANTVESYKNFLSSTVRQKAEYDLKKVEAEIAMLQARKAELVAEDARRSYEFSQERVAAMKCKLIAAGVISGDLDRPSFTKDLEAFLRRRESEFALRRSKKIQSADGGSSSID